MFSCLPDVSPQTLKDDTITPPQNFTHTHTHTQHSYMVSSGKRKKERYTFTHSQIFPLKNTACYRTARADCCSGGGSGGGLSFMPLYRHCLFLRMPIVFMSRKRTAKSKRWWFSAVAQFLCSDTFSLFKTNLNPKVYTLLHASRQNYVFISRIF